MKIFYDGELSKSEISYYRWQEFELYNNILRVAWESDKTDFYTLLCLIPYKLFGPNVQKDYEKAVREALVLTPNYSFIATRKGTIMNWEEPPRDPLTRLATKCEIKEEKSDIWWETERREEIQELENFEEAP